MESRIEADWVSRFADEVIAEGQSRVPGTPIVCASGLSPSGPIHLGNLREVMTPHLVADEIRRRGYECRHILSWDDYDRLRKVPAGVDPAWAQHIGKPLSLVPAPPGSLHANWADHFKAPMIDALTALGIEVEPISQTQRYTSGAYRDQIVRAMRERSTIDTVLDQYRTKGRIATSPLRPATKAERSPEQAIAGSGAATDDDGSAPAGYSPYKPYCTACLTDLTTVTSYDDDNTALSYTCSCGHAETVSLLTHNHGKLVWKVDWPMRWAYENVSFEPSGVDHSSPGSSFSVGSRIVADVFSGRAPIGPMYAFVGISGMAKMSSSRGAVPTPADALRIMEPPLLRWLYVRRRPNQSFTIDFDQEVHRLYDEWDALNRRITDGTASPADVNVHTRAIRTSTGSLPLTSRPVSFRTLASIADITTGDESQILRILQDIDPMDPVTSLSQVQPRLDCAQQWVNTQMPDDQRTKVRSEPDAELLATLTPDEQRSVELLLDGFDTHWSLQGLTGLVYGVPKLLAGLPLDTRPTPELKASQRHFFALLYTLLIGRDTGPRLPTLLLSAGSSRIRTLLTGLKNATR